MANASSTQAPPDRDGQGSDPWAWAQGVFVLVLFAIAGLMMSGGGLGVAGVAGLGGVGALISAGVNRRVSRRTIRPGVLAAVGLALLAWASVSVIWSPLGSTQQLVKLVIGAPLYVGFVLLCLSLTGRARRLARAGVVLAVISAASFFAFEAVSGGVVTDAHRNSVDQIAVVWRNLGHGLSAWVMFLPAAIGLLWPGGRATRIVVAVLAGVGVIAALRFGLTTNLLGLVAAAIAALAARRAPRAAIAVVGAIGAVSILMAPLVGLAAAAAPDVVRAALPLSWELRLEAWAFSSAHIFEKPLFGWGFDASRSLSDFIELRGRAFSALPLHPHNAGLHVWLELGLAGALLVAALIALVTRAVLRAPGLGRVQAIVLAATAAAYVAMEQVSYGIWQEWWLATAACGAAVVALLGDDPPAAGRVS